MNPRRRRHKRVRHSASYQTYLEAGRLLNKFAVDAKPTVYEVFAVIRAAHLYPTSFGLLLKNQAAQTLVRRYERLRRMVDWRRQHPYLKPDRAEEFAPLELEALSAIASRTS